MLLIHTQVNMIFQNGSTINICGCSGSGKTTFCYRLIKYADQLFSEKLSHIKIYYKAWQPLYTKMFNEFPQGYVSFVPGLPTKDQILDYNEQYKGKHKAIVVDDLSISYCNSETALDLVFVYAHHFNISVTTLTHEMFCRSKYARTISLNQRYLISSLHFINKTKVRNVGVNLKKLLWFHFIQMFCFLLFN